MRYQFTGHRFDVRYRRRLWPWQRLWWSAGARSQRRRRA